LQQLLQGLEKYGYDPKLIEHEMGTIQRNMRDDKDQRSYPKELHAAQAFALAEEAIWERRWKEV
jgi:hypothetical protein